jgi:hypothetical protein
MNLFNFILIIAAFAMIISPSAAEVKTVTYCDALPMRAGSWSDNHTLPLFDPTMGELLRVDLAVDLEAQQDFQFENEGSGDAIVVVDSDFELSITMPDSSLVAAAASRSISEDLAAFDGEVDFSGPSGRTIEGLESTGSVEQEYLRLADFIASAPGETISLPATVQVRSRTQLPGNCAFSMATLSGSGFCVTYVYDPEADGDE